jgi:hypothetical protein
VPVGSKLVPLSERSGAARKANPSRGGSAKPKGLWVGDGPETAGLPNGGGVMIVERTLEFRAPPLHIERSGASPCAYPRFFVRPSVWGRRSALGRKVAIRRWMARYFIASCSYRSLFLSLSVCVLRATDWGLPDQ